MRHDDFNEKNFPIGVKCTSEEAMNMSNQIADMMREKCASNCNINMVMIGLKDEMGAFDGGNKEKLLAGNPKDDFSAKSFGGALDSKKGVFEKDYGATIDFLSAGETVTFKKDEYGNLIKVARDGGQKNPTHQANLEFPILYR